jgi:hypothetical protein
MVFPNRSIIFKNESFAGVTDFLPLPIHPDDEFAEIFAVQQADECLRCIF